MHPHGPSAALGARRPDPRDLLALWQRYRASGDRVLRDRLVLTFAPLVKHAAARTPGDRDALAARGIGMLIAALDEYDPDRGEPLEEFLWGRLLDGFTLPAAPGGVLPR